MKECTGEFGLEQGCVCWCDDGERGGGGRQENSLGSPLLANNPDPAKELVVEPGAPPFKVFNL